LKQQDIRPQELFARYLELVRQDCFRFFPRPQELSPRPCPFCGAHDPRPAFSKEGFAYVTCGRCASLYADPCPTSQQLDEFYRDCPSARFWAKEFYAKTAEPRRHSIHRPRAERLQHEMRQRCLKPSLIIDVGCGYGIFLEELARVFPAARVMGVEPGEELAAEAARRGVNVFRGNASQARDPLTGQAQAVTCFEVLEHLAEPLDLLKDMATMLGPGGVLWLTTLGSDGFDIRILWEKHPNIYPPCHINIPSLAGLRHLLKRAGLGKTAIETPGRLDVQIVRQAMAQGEGLPRLGRFLEDLLGEDQGEAGNDFQQFLATHGLSSHVWAFAVKE